MQCKKEILRKILKTKSYLYCSNPLFKLTSGKTSPHYIDCKLTTNNATGIVIIGELVFQLVKDLDIKAIGGLTMGADPIAYSTSIISTQNNKLLNTFSVRKKEKEHGTKKLIEGDVQKGDSVVIVDDVITTGNSTIKAIVAAEDFGLKVEKVIVLVDRQEGGRKEIEKYVKTIESIFTLEDLIYN